MAFVVSALAADIAAATLAIVAACHFTIPSIDFECALLFVLFIIIIIIIIVGYLLADADVTQRSQQLEASVELQAALAEKTSLLARISQRIQSPSNESTALADS